MYEIPVAYFSLECNKTTTRYTDISGVAVKEKNSIFDNEIISSLIPFKEFLHYLLVRKYYTNLINLFRWIFWNNLKYEYIIIYNFKQIFKTCPIDLLDYIKILSFSRLVSRKNTYSVSRKLAKSHKDDRSSRNSINDVKSNRSCGSFQYAESASGFQSAIEFADSERAWNVTSSIQRCCGHSLHPSLSPSPLTFFSRRMQLLRFHLQERVITISGLVIINNNEFDAYSRLLPSSIFLRSLVVDFVYFLTSKNGGSANDVIFRM